MSNSQSVSASYLRGCSEELGNGFWQQWQQYQDYLYRCCVKWMGGNPIDAEDALSRAMLKAWEKVQKYAGEIGNFKAWLVTLTRNLCVDIHRERSRGANRVEDIEGYASGEEEGLVSFENTPESAVENGERRIVIRRAIDNLPARLRETFILHFYQELSYPEIAQQQDISYQNVCKRISQARKILQEELREYFIGEEGTDRDKSVPLTATESAIGEMSEGNGGVEARTGETVLAVAVEEVESVGGEEAQEVKNSQFGFDIVFIVFSQHLFMITDSSVRAAIEQNTISALLNLSEDIPVPVADIDAVADALWEKYKEEIRKDENRKKENTDKSITYQGKKMRFTVEKKGTMPATGYPVFIALHGGGETSADANNGEWKNVQTLWAGDVNPGIYIAVRGITDTWKLHFEDESYPMYDRLIENMIAFEDADPNAIYIMGFSAGGDGVYQITAKMADRFAAANMMAGHPNGVNIDNYANVPFLIQMGEKDADYGRNKEAENYDDRMAKAAKDKGYGYIHATFIHQLPDPGPNPNPYYYHNGWLDRTYASSSHTQAVRGGVKSEKTASIPWMKQYTRHPLPPRVIWNTKDPAKLRQTKRFYWLNAGPTPDGSILDVQVQPGSNSINVLQGGKYVGILLNPKMVDFNKPVDIIKGSDRIKVQFTPSLKKMVETLVDRGDPNYIFPTEITIKNDGPLKISSQSAFRVDNMIPGSGSSFMDMPAEGAHLKTLTLYSGDVLDSIQADYGITGLMPKHGGNGGGKTVINFAPDEYIVEVSGKYGNYHDISHVAQLIIRTSKDTSYTVGMDNKVSNPTSFSFKANPKNKEAIVAFYGSVGVHTDGSAFISGLGVGYRPIV